MTEFSDFLEGRILDHLFTKTTFVPSTALWVAAATVAIDDSDTSASLTEPASNYARAKTYTADWTRAANVIDNDNDIEFVVATGSWGTITHIALCDVVSGAGNMWAYTPITSKLIELDDQLRFLAGTLDFSVD